MLGLIAAIALGLRLWRLTYHSFWFDEAVSAYWASRPAGEIVRVGLGLTLDKHPPVYYLLLRIWRLLLGDGDAALRSLGAIMGTLAVFPVYGLASRWGGRRAGFVAAVLVAINPFLIWYSQEVRMFMPAALFGLMSLWGLAEALESRARWGWAWFTLGAWLGVYAYLFNALLLPAAGLWWLASLRRRRLSLRPLLAEAGIMAITAAGILPLMWRAWRVSQAESSPGRAFAGAGDTLWRLGQAFLIHRAPLHELAMVGIIAGIIALAGAALSRQGRWELGTGLLSPWLIGLILQASDASVFAEPRYWLFLAPLLCVAWGVGLARLTAWPSAPVRAAGRLSLMALAVVMLVAVPWNWRPETRREDWRAAARYIETHAGPRDAILVHVDYVKTAFLRYYRGDLPVYFPFGGPVRGFDDVAKPLEGLRDFEVVWLVESHLEGVDDGRWVERWLGDRYPLVTEQFPAGVTVRGYLVGWNAPTEPADVARIGRPLAPGVELVGCHIHEHAVSARDDVYHPPSGWVHVTAYWRRAGDVSAEALPRVRLVDALGQVWGAGLDRPRALWRLYPPPKWEVGAVVRDDHDVNLNPLTPPGVYRVVIAVVDATGQPLGDEVSCGDVEVH
ncbi:MAG: glycosyltransferase family 39 protein [Anaerolineae bacterium]